MSNRLTGIALWLSVAALAAQQPAEPGDRIEWLLQRLDRPEWRQDVLAALGELDDEAALRLLDAHQQARTHGRTANADALLVVLGKVARRGAKARTALEKLCRQGDDDVAWQAHRALASAWLPSGSTVIADYADNSIVLLDAKGAKTAIVEGVFGVWDVELLPNGNWLVTEFSVSRVGEMTPKGIIVWSYTDLRNPYDADALPNGNVLIADTFRNRVIEVDRKGKVVWTFATDIRPFDVDRLANGNTLIADALNHRVLEVDRAGEIVLEFKDLPNVHDADRLPNGNTLVTVRRRNEVLELDPKGTIVFALRGLTSPSDADRLPNGNTLVAENRQVREFDAKGDVVWRHATQWAVEANRY